MDTAQERFQNLSDRWKEETRFESRPTVRAEHEAYQQIIGMGSAALPLLVEELRDNKDNPDDWFWALRAITGANPVPPEDRGKFVKMAQHWLQWASNRGVARWTREY